MPKLSATLPELPKQGKRLFLPKRTREFFMPTVNYQLQELQCYQVTSHRLPATKRDIIRQMN